MGFDKIKMNNVIRSYTPMKDSILTHRMTHQKGLVPGPTVSQILLAFSRIFVYKNMEKTFKKTHHNTSSVDRVPWKDMTM